MKLINHIYLCGKITGLPAQEVRDKFDRAERYWYDNGMIPVNPVKVVNNINATWEDAMKKCITELMKCQYIYVLDDWQTSQGAKLEIVIAKSIGIQIVPQQYTQMKLIWRHVATYNINLIPEDVRL